YVLVILNYRLPSLAALLWQRARLRMCADGGANRLYNELPLLLGQEESIAVLRIKSLISGKFVSSFSFQGTVVLDKSHDQDTVDLHKCIYFVAEKSSKYQCKNCLALNILVVGALGGKLDHEMGNINVHFSFRSFRIMVYFLPRDVLHTIPGSFLSADPARQHTHDSFVKYFHHSSR
ncbi:hypothetical protein SELMODRAFT_123932, partial [Selaginella moellendorffii]